MIPKIMPLTPVTSTHSQGMDPVKPLIDKTGRFNRLQTAFQKQLKQLAHDFYQKYQTPLILTDTFRTKAEQARVHREKPNLALPANHPNAMHPRGLAVDVDQNQAGKITPEMLAKNGLHLPALAKGETWHIEPKFSSSRGSSPSSQRSWSCSKSQLSANTALLKSFSQRTSKLRQHLQLSEPLDRLKQQALTEGEASDDRRRLQAAMEVEAIFLRQLLEQMRGAMVHSVGSSHQDRRGYLHMADVHLAHSLAAGGGLGLAAKILQDMTPPESHPQKENHHEGNLPLPGQTEDSRGNLPLSRTS